MALKTEIEAVGEYQRKQNLENLALMKNFTSTLKQLKESSREFRLNEIQTRDIMSQMIDYFSILNSLFSSADDN